MEIVELGLIERQPDVWIYIFIEIAKVHRGEKSELEVWSDLSDKYAIVRR